MAGKWKEMNKIKQALRLHLDGESNRSIGRKPDLYKGTVNKYITLAESCGTGPFGVSLNLNVLGRIVTQGYRELSNHLRNLSWLIPLEFPRCG